MLRTNVWVPAASLVLLPLLILLYWLFYPAYGELDPREILIAIDGHATQTALANASALAGSFLAVPATFGLMRVLSPRAPRLALIGGSLTIVGWVALVGVLMLDIVAAEIAQSSEGVSASLDLFDQISTSPTVLAMNALVAMHLVGAVVTGIALWRTALIPRWAAALATITQPIHLLANVSGILPVDAATWIALAVAYAFVARILIAPAGRASEQPR